MSSRNVHLTTAQARYLALKKSLLTETSLPEARTGVLQALESLGYVQIDTISVVERSHNIVFRTRCPDYRPEFLDQLLVSEKKIFEHWAHAASYIPLGDYRFYRRSIERKPKEGSWVESWSGKHRRLLREVRRRIETEGPLSALDFKDTRKKKGEGWWDWKPSKMALEVLFWQGELMVAERKNFRKIYDLPERVLPTGLDTSLPTKDEERRFFVRRALGGLGVASQQEIANYIKISGPLRESVAKMVDEGEILEARIEDLEKPYYVLASDLQLLEGSTRYDGKARMISPFDNAIIFRDRVRALFDFDYRLECYTPREKRQHGYFCLPILWHDQFAGRIDPKADRKRRVLVIKNLTLEKHAPQHPTFFPALSEALQEFATFNDCDTIEPDPNIPRSLIKPLQI